MLCKRVLQQFYHVLVTCYKALVVLQCVHHVPINTSLVRATVRFEIPCKPFCICFTQHYGLCAECYHFRSCTVVFIAAYAVVESIAYYYEAVDFFVIDALAHPCICSSYFRKHLPPNLDVVLCCHCRVFTFVGAAVLLLPVSNLTYIIILWQLIQSAWAISRSLLSSFATLLWLLLRSSAVPSCLRTTMS